MERTNEHSILLNKLLIKLGECPELGRFWRNETGTALSMDGKRVIRYGLVGSADILGFSNQGRFCAFEIKTGRGVQSKQQKAFQETLNNHGGFYLVVRDAEEAILEIKKGLLQVGLFS